MRFKYGGAARSYRYQVEWGLYRVYGLPRGVWHMEWRPRTEIGGYAPFSIKASDIPNWKNGRWCADVKGGEWFRSDGNGYEYGLATAVKFKKDIGFDLSGKHAWSTEIDSIYDIRGSRMQQICGKDTWPQTASKFQMK